MRELCIKMYHNYKIDIRTIENKSIIHSIRLKICYLKEMLTQFLVGNLEVFRKRHIITTLSSLHEKVKIRKRRKKEISNSKIKKSHWLILAILFFWQQKACSEQRYQSLHLIYRRKFERVRKWTNKGGCLSNLTLR